ncbi:MAG: DNA polymerase III subunit gamma/tau [Tissierellia bacterium]|nr:DNA polymerase III subunit gamma/tau [Tissierellia bacterium]
MGALYRKYRPQTFDEVVGQRMITTALKNQVASNTVAHSYLFSGTRGTGKTSCAKILARGVNCLHPRDGNPCNECENCRGILEERILDVVEMDAASNNSVDDIRDLKDNAQYPPSVAKKKVYIIDEVHMLSKGAFNALLKILEEPPEYVLFLLATTEPERIPDTILSRTQRFSFGRLTEEEILGELEEVLKKEGEKAGPGALELLAHRADGSMRDGLTLLDQSLSLAAGEELTAEVVRRTLGLAGNEAMIRLTDAVILQDVRLGFQLIGTLYSQGVALGRVLEDLMGYFRDLLVYSFTRKVPMAYSPQEGEALEAQFLKLGEGPLLAMTSLLSDAQRDLRLAEDQRLFLELLLLRLMAIKGGQGGGNEEPAPREALFQPRESSQAEEPPSVQMPGITVQSEEAESEGGREAATGSPEEKGEERSDLFLDHWQRVKALVAGDVMTTELMERLEPQSFHHGVLVLYLDPQYDFLLQLNDLNEVKEKIRTAAGEVLGEVQEIRLIREKSLLQPEEILRGLFGADKLFIEESEEKNG